MHERDPVTPDIQYQPELSQDIVYEVFRNFAKCRGENTDIFFSDLKEPTTEAIKICRTCEIEKFCLDYALFENLDDGVYGGYSGSGRRRLKKIRKTIINRVV